MNYYNLEELKARIIAGLDVYQFLDILGVSFPELVERFEDVLEDNYEELIVCLGEPPLL